MRKQQQKEKQEEEKQHGAATNAITKSKTSTNNSTEKRERNKTMNTIAAKMKSVVEKMIENGRNGNCNRQVTIFVYKSQQSEIIYSFFQELRKENPRLFENKESLLSALSEKYDEMLFSLNDESMCCSSSKTLYYSRFLISN